jgi:hypothetical protein
VVLVAGGLFVVGGLSAGCGSPVLDTPTTPAAATATTAPPTPAPTPVAPTPRPAPRASAAATPARTAAPSVGADDVENPVTMPWPASTADEAARLQSSVDGGAEPWLLDPTEVALSYVTAAHGWTGAQVRPRADGRTVDVQDGARTLVLSLNQPARTGADGIWVVTAESTTG